MTLYSTVHLAVLTHLSVNTIQAYLMLAIRELMIWSNIKAYIYAGTALRMAQALYLNVEAHQHYSPRQKEIRRRTFWACFVVDRLIIFMQQAVHVIFQVSSSSTSMS